MSADVKIFGRIRQLLQGVDQASVGDDEQLALNEQLAQLVALDSSPYGEIVKLGRAFEVHTTAAIAAVVAVPTTAHMLAIQNLENDGGRSLFIDRVWAMNIVSPATAGQAALIGCLGQTRVATLAAGGLKVNALNGFNGNDTRALNAVNATALDGVTGVAANWRLLPGQSGIPHIPAAATPGWWINADVNGRIVVPPGRIFAMHVLGDIVTETFVAGIEWHEKQVRLG